jgi:recombination protein RecT
MSTEISIYDAFKNELAHRHDEIAAILPPHIPEEKFIQTAIIAVKNNPDLLIKATRKSLHEAVTEAAEDGLHPDGREGAIVIFGNEAQWSPMIFGIRKRAMELSRMTIDAQVVYANDKFARDQGDHPSIKHRPTPPGEPRGDLVACYAIFKIGAEVIHREYMDRDEVYAARNQSRGWQKSLMWTKFEGEAWRKTVVRRGIKSAPSVPELERVIAREDRNFSFAPSQAPAVPLSDIPNAPSAPSEKQQREVMAPGGMIAEAEVIENRQDAPPNQQGSPPVRETQREAPKAQAAPASALTQFQAVLNAATSTSALNDAWGMFDKRLTGAERDKALALFEAAYEGMGAG